MKRPAVFRTAVVALGVGIPLAVAAPLGYAAYSDSQAGQNERVFACLSTEDGAVRMVAALPCAEGEQPLTGEVQGRAGKPGKAGPAGKKGARGAQGVKGPKGPAGAKGKTGANGKKGAAGPTGRPGPQGQPGAAGAVGPRGAAGPAGPAGPQGPAGQGASVRYVDRTFTLEAGDSDAQQERAASCPEGTQVLNGSVLPESTAGYDADRSYPDPERNAWVVALSPDPESRSAATIRVVCLG